MEAVEKRKTIFVEKSMCKTVGISIWGSTYELTIHTSPKDPIGVMYVYDSIPEGANVSDYVVATIPE